MALLGVMGLGLVWGWLIGGRRLTTSRWPRNVTIFGLGAILACSQVFLLTSGSAQLAAVYLAAFGLSLVVHRAWIYELQSRFGSGSSQD